jgi:hypothetical protein
LVLIVAIPIVPIIVEVAWLYILSLIVKIIAGEWQKRAYAKS